MFKYRLKATMIYFRTLFRIFNKAEFVQLLLLYSAEFAQFQIVSINDVIAANFSFFGVMVSTFLLIIVM